MVKIILEKAMATHSSVLAWRIPGMGEPCGLPSMWSHRVGHGWSNLAAAAADLILSILSTIKKIYSMFMSKKCRILFLLVFSHSVRSDCLRPHRLQYTRPPCPSPTPGACSNSCPLSWWCHLIISPLLTPSPFAFNLSQHQSLFHWVGSLHQVATVWELQHQSFQFYSFNF